MSTIFYNSSTWGYASIIHVGFAISNSPVGKCWQGTNPPLWARPTFTRSSCAGFQEALWCVKHHLHVFYFWGNRPCTKLCDRHPTSSQTETSGLPEIASLSKTAVAAVRMNLKEIDSKHVKTSFDFPVFGTSLVV